MNASQQKIKAFILCLFRNKAFKLSEIAYFKPELDFYWKLLVSDLFHKGQIVREFMHPCISVKPCIHVFTVCTHSVIHWHKLLKSITMLQQAYLINPHFNCSAYKLIDPVKRVCSPFNMDMPVYHFLPPAQIRNYITVPLSKILHKFQPVHLHQKNILPLSLFQIYIPSLFLLSDQRSNTPELLPLDI